ncbi:TPA: hypothetical protein HA278_01490 [Candidatus Woesearchaeota archaeon]|nr:hypothetical protein [Candidatus Woesearchaeota archaeon]
MAWDAYLNLGVRANQSAYYEYFLPIQVEIGETFLMDELNFIATFDTGNINPFAHQLGLSVQNVEISLPYWEEPEEEEEIPVEPSSEPSEEEIEEPEEDTAVIEPSEEQVEEPSNDEMPALDEGTPVKSGCSTVATDFSPVAFFAAWLIVLFRKED